MNNSMLFVVIDFDSKTLIAYYAQNSPQGVKSPERYSMLVDVRNLSQGCYKASKNRVVFLGYPQNAS